MVQIKSKREIESMRQVGKMVSQILQKVASMVAPGVTPIELDREAEKMARELGARPAFKGYLGFQHALCASVNEAIVHGIPSERPLKDGDIIGLDFGLVKDGFYGDSAITVPVGTMSDETRRLLRTTCNALYAAIKAARPGNTLKDLARAIENVVNPQGYGIVREFVGHGIGRRLHEDPQIPNYASGASNVPLRAGMTIAIEPMINTGNRGVKVLDDKWTAVTVDGKYSAHYEHSIAILEDKTEVLTEWGSPVYGGFLEQMGVFGDDFMLPSDPQAGEVSSHT